MVDPSESETVQGLKVNSPGSAPQFHAGSKPPRSTYLYLFYKAKLVKLCVFINSELETLETTNLMILEILPPW